MRRVEPELACVWVALSGPREVQLDIWAGAEIKADAAPAPDFAGKPAKAIRVAANLYIAFATVAPATGGNFLPEKVYSYNLTLRPPGARTAETLASLGLLKDRGKEHLALGYDAGRLPTFVLPPRELTDLRIIHGSCRRPHVEVPDAMVWIDELIGSDRGDARKRPHQLFLTGDQIYADDVGMAVMPWIAAMGTRLFGDECVPTRWPHLDKKRQTTFVSVAESFPPGFRQRAMIEDARFTTSDGANHLISLADFAVHYLLAWSRDVWPESFPSAEDYLKAARAARDTLLKASGTTDDTATWLKGVVAGMEKAPGDGERNFAERYARHIGVLTAFRDGLPQVRRALANIATYMTFDDHEITDDWFISAAWRDRVLTSPLGRTIFRNGLLAYALFQGWGNDPAVLDNKDSPHARLRLLVEKAVTTDDDTESFKPDPKVSAELESLLGLSGDPLPEAGAEPSTKIARWHFAVSGPRHRVHVLDVRMRRGYKSRLSGPGNVAPEALKEQIPDRPLPAEIEVVFIISGLTVLGPPVIDGLLGPVLYRSFDLKSNVTKGPEASPIAGLDPDAIEAWPNDDIAFEALLARVAPFKRVVFLSGDVHFGTSAAMSYFRKGDDRPARFAQFTSSGLKNRFKELIVNLDHSLAFMQRVATEGTRMERLGWEKRGNNLVTGVAPKKIRPALRARLETAPVLLPVHGWPAGTKSAESDWSWRLHVVEDTRAAADRPELSRPAVLVPGKPKQDVKRDPDGFRKVAARHAAHLERFVFGRRILFAANLGVVTFAREVDEAASGPVLVAIHELHSALPEDARSQVYTRHVVKLEAPGEKRPRIGGPA